jgi:signal peptidase I
LRRTLRFAGQALQAAVLTAAGLILVAAVVVPRFLGGATYTVLTGSMAPTYPVGSLVVVRPSDHIATGDVITYQLRPGMPEVVTHRVVGVGVTTAGERTYVTKGDANKITDATPVRQAQVRGKVLYSLPWLGYLTTLLPGGARRSATIGVVGALVAYAAWQVIHARRERGKRRPDPALDHASEPDRSMR